jgi:transcriptional regulator with XRE-family HTH domain
VKTPAKPEKAAYQGVDIPKQVREALDMRLTELAGLTGLDIALLSRVERGERRPTIANAMKIARALGRPVNVLFPNLIAE